jgi:UDP-N-acetyl-D-glucosamine dehydrogenase
VKIVIIGQGYVGSALAFAAAKAGHNVIGFDTNTKVIGDLKEKESNLKNYFPTNTEADLKDQDAYIIAVPTPLDENNLPDLSYLIQASILIAKSATKGALVINESTSYPGTLREIVITEIEKVNKSEFLYASAPERIDPANSKWNIKNTPRILAGINEQSTTAALEFYKSICADVTTVSSPEVAESAKLFENTFRQVNIALVNELAQITEKLGVSANEVIKAAATKPFGFMKFNPSLGVGGHCIPIDPIYLAQKAESVGASAQFIRQANLVNQQMPMYVLKRLEGLLGGDISSKKICIVGISYKPDVTDMRQSPAVVLWKELEKKGALVSFHDEIVKEFDGKTSTALAPNIFDLTVVAVAHSNLEVDKVINSAPIIFDCTGTINGAHQL